MIPTENFRGFRGGYFGLDDACTHAFCLHTDTNGFSLWGYEFETGVEASLNIPRNLFPKDAEFLGPRRVQSCFGTVGIVAQSKEQGLVAKYAYWPWRELHSVRLPEVRSIDRFSMLPAWEGHPFCGWEPRRFQPLFWGPNGPLEGPFKKSLPWRCPLRDSPILGPPRFFFQSWSLGETRLIPFGGQPGVYFGKSSQEDRKSLGLVVGLSRFGVVRHVKGSPSSEFEVCTPTSSGELIRSSEFVWGPAGYDLGFVAESSTGGGGFFAFSQKREKDPGDPNCMVTRPGLALRVV